MKKCSRSAHHSLTELNITPLLDLAFVLLVIFIITTAPPVNETDLKLPDAAKRLKDPPQQANYISIDSTGALYLNKKRMNNAQDMLQTLVSLRMDTPDLNVIVRGDAKTKYRQIREVIDVCQQANVVKVDLATEPFK